MTREELMLPSAPALGDSLCLPAQREWQRELQAVPLPNDGRRYEMIRHERYLLPTSDAAHQVTLGELYFHLRRFVRRYAPGLVVCAPCELVLGEDTLLHPDVLFFAEPPAVVVGQRFMGVPTLAVEVVTPASAQHDHERKFAAYETAGVPELWLADVTHHVVEVYTLSAGEYAWLGRFTAADELHSAVLPGLTIRPKLLFSM